MKEKVVLKKQKNSLGFRWQVVGGFTGVRLGQKTACQLKTH